MKFVTQESDGTLVIDSEFFSQFMDTNDMIELVLTIERRNGQINVMNPRVNRNGIKEKIEAIGSVARSKKAG